MNRETSLMHSMMLALSEAGCLIWRHNVGKAWQGKPIHQAGSQVTLTDARMIPYGLCVGGADLLGIAPDGRFLAIEAKTATGRISADQQRFISAVRLAGGRAGVARTIEEALQLARG